MFNLQFTYRNTLLVEAGLSHLLMPVFEHGQDVACRILEPGDGRTILAISCLCSRLSCRTYTGLWVLMLPQPGKERFPMFFVMLARALEAGNSVPEDVLSLVKS
jgi:hypothetical protein